MKLMPFAITLVVAAVAASASAADTKKPVSKWTCAEFIGVDDQFKPKVVYAATAYSKAVNPKAR
jgi:acid stress chaperone HdeA